MHNDIRTLKSTPAQSDPKEPHGPLQAFPEAVKPIQIDGQCFKHAFHARLENRRLEPPGTEDTAFLARAVSAWHEIGPDVTSEAMLELLLARASLIDPETDAQLASAEALTPKRVWKLLHETEELAALRARQIKRQSMNTATVPSMNRWLRAELPPVSAEIFRRPAPTPWDAKNDGHIVRRSSAWALGIIRWARTLLRERSDRITRAIEACARTAGLQGPELREASLLWADRRPLLFISSFTIHAEKLLHDLWLTDPSIGFICMDPRVKKNPAARLKIPFVSDPAGLIAACFGLDRFPTVIEPRIGGFTATSATGILGLDQLPAEAMKKNGLAVPVWKRTLAEMAHLSRWNETEYTQGIANLPAGKRLKYLQAYRELIRVPICVPPKPENLGAAERILIVRQLFLRRREQLLILIGKEEEKAEAQLRASRAMHAAERTKRETAEADGASSQ